MHWTWLESYSKYLYDFEATVHWIWWKSWLLSSRQCMTETAKRRRSPWIPTMNRSRFRRHLGLHLQTPSQLPHRHQGHCPPGAVGVFFGAPKNQTQYVTIRMWPWKHHLVGGAITCFNLKPSWKMMEFVNGMMKIPYMKWKVCQNSMVPVTTNQINFQWDFPSSIWICNPCWNSTLMWPYPPKNPYVYCLFESQWSVWSFAFQTEFLMFQAYYYLLVNKHSYWKWPFIVDLPIKKCDFP